MLKHSDMRTDLKHLSATPTTASGRLQVWVHDFLPGPCNISPPFPAPLSVEQTVFCRTSYRAGNEFVPQPFNQPFRSLADEWNVVPVFHPVLSHTADPALLFDNPKFLASGLHTTIRKEIVLAVKQPSTAQI